MDLVSPRSELAEQRAEREKVADGREVYASTTAIAHLGGHHQSDQSDPATATNYLAAL